MFGKLKTKIYFHVVEGVLLGVLMEILDMERRSAQIGFHGQYVDFAISKKSVRVGFEPERTLNKPYDD